MRHFYSSLVRPALTKLLALFILIGFLYIYGFGVDRFKPEMIRDLMVALGYWGPLLYILCNLLRPLFFFPAIILGVAGGLAFGPLWGTIYLIIGTLLGAVLCFGLARMLGRERLKQYLPRWIRFEQFNTQVAQNSFKTMLILRLLPVFPWDVVSFMSGLSNVRIWPYLLSTLVGSIPGAIAFSYWGDTLSHSVSTTLISIVVMVVLLIYLPVAYWWMGKRKDIDSRLERM